MIIFPSLTSRLCLLGTIKRNFLPLKLGHSRRWEEEKTDGSTDRRPGFGIGALEGVEYVCHIFLQKLLCRDHRGGRCPRLRLRYIYIFSSRDPRTDFRVPIHTSPRSIAITGCHRCLKPLLPPPHLTSGDVPRHATTLRGIQHATLFRTHPSSSKDSIPGQNPA